jgi:LPXTG-motif cell wall-anchored protein
MPSVPDHCTFWPDRFAGMDWSHCCAAHDLAYRTGIPGMGRAAADAELFRCVTEATGAHWFAGLMFAGVSVFGWVFWRRKKKW